MQLLEIAMHDFHTAGRAMNRRRRKPSFAFFVLAEEKPPICWRLRYIQSEGRGKEEG
jgi:hypothetical protein